MLAAWLDAKRARGRIILRIEDIDLQRTQDGAQDGILRDLEWLGLDWDGAITVQSARMDRFEAALEKLARMDRIYPCTCSRKEIALASSAPHGPSDEGPRYPGICRPHAAAGCGPSRTEGPGRAGARAAGIKREQPERRPRVLKDGAKKAAEGRTPSIRLKTMPGDTVAHTDRRFGAVDQDVYEAVGDFILKRADGMWAYQLAVSVDDLEEGVTDIVRGSDLLRSTPRQILLRRLLDPSAPPLSTLHVPLILGPGGQRLAKRDGAIAVADRRARGQSPDSLVGELAWSLGQLPNKQDVRAEELVELWDPQKIPLEDQKLEAIE
jgi:glutamyl-tRNA synthetase